MNSGEISRKQKKKSVRGKNESKKYVNVNRKLEVKEVILCVIGNETFEEDWVQCIKCTGWAHFACTE